MKKLKLNSVQEWLPFKKILNNGIILLKDFSYVKILKITPINYNLKSNLEKEAILNSYKLFLKTCNFNIQILIQSNKEDLSHHISKIEKNMNKKENKYLENLSKNYIEYINKINLTKKSSSKDFYIIISSESEHSIESQEIIFSDLKEKYFKIKECLSRCGNSVIELNKEKEILNLFFSFFNTRKHMNKNSYNDI